MSCNGKLESETTQTGKTGVARDRDIDQASPGWTWLPSASCFPFLLKTFLRILFPHVFLMSREHRPRIRRKVSAWRIHDSFLSFFCLLSRECRLQLPGRMSAGARDVSDTGCWHVANTLLTLMSFRAHQLFPQEDASLTLTHTHAHTHAHTHTLVK